MSDHARSDRAHDTPFELRGGVRVPFGICQKRALDMLGIAKVRCMFGTSVANDDQLGAVTPYRWKDVPQLRDLLAAENSSEVADEGEDNRLLLPEIAEAYGGPSRVEHFDVA